MNIHDPLTDEQKELLRVIIKCDEEGRLAEKGFLRFMLGGDKYMLWGCGIELESLSDLDALCDAGLLKRERGRPDPIYRIKNAARDAVKSNFGVLPAQVATEIKKGIKPQANHKKEKVGSTMETSLSSKNIWDEIQKDYGISKGGFGKKFNFVTDQFKRRIIFRDVEHAYILASRGFSKPAVILAGGVIEELLRLYLEYKGIKPANRTFDSYIKTCIDNELLKTAISRLTDSVRHFRNIVHLQKEDSPRITISKATAKGAVASIFTLANDF